MYKNSDIPLHEDLPTADALPWTISFVIRKRAQLDSYAELPEEKRPPDDMIWWGSNKDITNWFKKVYKHKDENPDEFVLKISDSDIG